MADSSKNQKTKTRKAKDEVEEDEIFTAPVIHREPVSKQVYLGQKISLRVTATGKPLPSFQWYLNGKKVSGATSDRFMVNKSRRDQAGAYTCEAKNFVGSTMSRAAMITFLTMKVPELKIAFSSTDTRINAGMPCKISVVSPTMDLLNKFEFRWVFNGRRIKDALQSELSFTAFKPKYSGEYKIMIIHGGEIYSSNVIKLSCISADQEIQKVEEIHHDPPLPSAVMDPVVKAEENFFFDPIEEHSSAKESLSEETLNPTPMLLSKKNTKKTSAKVTLLQNLLDRLEARKTLAFSKAS